MRCGIDDCKGPIKPDITFFGESLPRSFFDALDRVEDIPKEDTKEAAEDPNSERKYPDGGCDLMIVIGTALAVAPFN